LQARFTFLYRKYNGVWRIAEHHSSAMPEQKPAGVEEMFDKWNAALQVSRCFAAAAAAAAAAKWRSCIANVLNNTRLMPSALN
jgi:hypothetical protein